MTEKEALKSKITRLLNLCEADYLRMIYDKIRWELHEKKNVKKYHEEQDFFRVKDICKILKISRRTCYRRIKDGTFDSRIAGGKGCIMTELRIHKKDFFDYMMRIYGSTPQSVMLMLNLDTHGIIGGTIAR